MTKRAFATSNFLELQLALPTTITTQSFPTPFDQPGYFPATCQLLCRTVISLEASPASSNSTISPSTSEPSMVVSNIDLT